MKRFLQILGLTLSISFVSCEKEVVSEMKKLDILSSSLDQFIINNYTIDAKTIYLNEIKANVNHPNYNNSTIDSAEVNKILKMLQAVYDLHTPLTDSIFKTSKIHMHCPANFRKYILAVKNTELPEIMNLANDIIPTGNTAFDDIFAAYPVATSHPAYPTAYPKLPFIEVTTQKDYNLLPILKLFKGHPQIDYTESVDFCAGDGDEIKLTRNGDENTLTFIHGTEDCPSGCMFNQSWVFKIKNGVATFIPYNYIVEPPMKL